MCDEMSRPGITDERLKELVVQMRRIADAVERRDKPIGFAVGGVINSAASNAKRVRS